MPEASTTTSSVVFVLSGGVTNTDPTASLGGPPSANPVLPASLNSLFDDVTGAEVSAGRIDHRCVYVFNDGADTIVDVEAFISEEYPLGSTTELGVSEANEVQVVSVTNSPTGGTFALILGAETTGPMTWNPSNAATAGIIQAALQPLLQGAGATVAAGTASNSFVVTWAGDNRHRKIPLMTIDVSGLAYNNFDPPPGGIVVEQVSGGPINSLAPLIDSAVAAPVGVNFDVPSSAFPFDIGTLRSGEGFPLWVRRTTDSEAEPTSTDGLVIKVMGDRILT